MARSLVYTSLLVPAYDEAIAFFTRVLRWSVQQDLRLSGDRHWDLIEPKRT